MTTAAVPGGPPVVERGSFATLLHGLRLAPEFRAGLSVTLTLAVLSTAGRVVVPLAVQQTIDHGLSGPTPDLALVRWACALAGLAVLVTAVANYLMAIAIRTAVLHGGRAVVQAGGGLVADSDPAAEQAECENKAAAVLRALAVAQTLRPA